MAFLFLPLAAGARIHSRTVQTVRKPLICLPSSVFCQITTGSNGKVHFDENGFPIAESTNHGIGTRSIAAYCEKHDAVCRYMTNNSWFTLQIVQNYLDGVTRRSRMQMQSSQRIHPTYRNFRTLSDLSNSIQPSKDVTRQAMSVGQRLSARL